MNSSVDEQPENVWLPFRGTDFALEWSDKEGGFGALAAAGRTEWKGFAPESDLYG